VILGRQAEIERLQAVLDSIRAGRGEMILLVGEPGIGKTTMLRWVRDQAVGVTVLEACGRESEADLPFVALADLLRPLQDRVAGLPAAQAAALGSALSAGQGAAADRLAVDTAALNLLSVATRDRPVLLLVDDLQWLDSASADVLGFVARRAGTVPIGVVMASRDGAPELPVHVRIDMSPLSVDASTELLRGRLDASPIRLRQLVEVAQGNPLALVELAEGRLLAAGTITSSGRSGRSALERAYAAMLEGLPAETRQALEVVAAEGSESLAVVDKAMRGLGLDPTALDPACNSRVVDMAGERVRFRHPLMRSVILAGADPARLLSVHRELAGAVSDPDRQAWHLASAAAGPDEAVAAALEESARRAMSRGGAATAARTWERAAAMSTIASEERRRLAAAARAAHQAGDLDLTAHLLASARAEDGGEDPSLRLLEADLRMRQGDFTGAERALREEAARLAPLDPYRAATMLLVAAKVPVYRFEAARALAEVRTALASVPKEERDVLHLGALSMVETMAGASTARASVRSAMEAAIKAPNGHTHTLGIGWPLVWLEEYGLARSFLERSIALQRNGGFLAYLPQAILPLAELDFRTGRWPEARSGAEEAWRLFRELGQPTEAAFASALLARLDAVTGDGAGAASHAAEAVIADASAGLRGASAMAAAALGLLELGQGALDEAVAHLTQAAGIAEAGKVGEPWLLPYQPDLAEALARTSRTEQAAAIGLELEVKGAESGRPSALAAGLRIKGLTASNGDFKAVLAQALEIHAALPTPFEAARTELCLGERLRRDRDRVQARLHLRRALAIFSDLGARPWAARAEAELSASGEVRNAANGTALTPQERQVAAMVAAGATNRETAEALFVSPKTIEFHLGNIYRKLGVRSRTELANALPAIRSASHPS
jgi:DNA-binding CsgD family transcriptional regulator